MMCINLLGCRATTNCQQYVHGPCRRSGTHSCILNSRIMPQILPHICRYIEAPVSLMKLAIIAGLSPADLDYCPQLWRANTADLTRGSCAQRDSRASRIGAALVCYSQRKQFPCSSFGGSTRAMHSMTAQAAIREQIKHQATIQGCYAAAWALERCANTAVRLKLEKWLGPDTSNPSGIPTSRRDKPAGKFSKKS